MLLLAIRYLSFVKDLFIKMYRKQKTLRPKISQDQVDNFMINIKFSAGILSIVIITNYLLDSLIVPTQLIILSTLRPAIVPAIAIL